MKINVAICDDKMAYNNLLSNLVNEYCSNKNINVSISTFISGTDLIKSIDMHNKYDIIFMDIELGNNETGINVVRKIKKIIPNVLVIYMSSFNSYYSELVQGEPFRFIDKAIIHKNFPNIMSEAIERLKMTNLEYIYSFSGNTYIINLYDVSYIYSIHRRIYFHQESVYNDLYCYKKLDDVELELNNICPFFCKG